MFAYMINDLVMPTPDTEQWSDNVVGVSLALTQRRSPYQMLIWRKAVVDGCRLDWFDYDNTALTSLTTRGPGDLKEVTRYTDVICQQVTMVQSREAGRQVEAHFLVNTT